MILIPAIDLKDGHCVRLRQGRMNDATVFDENPLDTADRWYKLGARRLHLVDLDGAFAGETVNQEAVRTICQRYPEWPVQIGGGIRDAETAAAYFNAGVSSIILGTSAVRDPQLVHGIVKEFPNRVILGLDARDGRVAVQGWAEVTSMNVLEVARNFSELPIEAIIFTDIACDGMMRGPNIEATKSLAESLSVPVIASGGVSSLEDLKALKEIERSGLLGVISGRALYEEKLDFSEGQALLDQENTPDQA